VKRTTCSGCGYDHLETFLDLGPSPIADAYTKSPEEVSPTHPLQLAVCTGCWLVQLLEVVDHETLFGTGYSFYSSASPPLSEYHRQYATQVIAENPKLLNRPIVEIGCNDGDLLQWFASGDRRDRQVLGVDPARGPVAAARQRGIGVLEMPFSSAVARRILNDDLGRQAGIVIANHVLAHVEDVSNVLEGISLLLADDGVAYIEVQYLPDLLTNNAFDLVYHEHRNFFSLSSLSKAAARWGLTPIDAQLTDRQGGSLRVQFARTRNRASPNVGMIRVEEKWLHSVGAYGGVQGRVDRIATRLRETLWGLQDDGAKLIGYGAPAKATTLLNFCNIGSGILDCVIDSTPAKQGRYIPGTGLRIVAPNEVDLRDYTGALLLAWNYSDVIMRKNAEFAARGGRWVVPIPAPVIL
jgi:SAM-dependent methyltransferase